MKNNKVQGVVPLAALFLTALAIGSPVLGQATNTQPASVPRTADGKPDFTGIYGGTPGLPSGADSQTFAGRDNSFENFETDNGLVRMGERNKPLYKPEYWQEVRDNDFFGNWRDPQLRCLRDGVPRLAAPSQIIQTKDFVVLLYNGGFAARNSVRVVPFTDKHNPARVAMESFLGDPIARWDGDTLVIETTGFTDTSWLHKNGYMHSFNMKVTERLGRVGNALTWEAVVDDPEYLQEPWKMPAMNATFKPGDLISAAAAPVLRQFNPNPAAYVPEDLPCDERDAEHIVSRTRSG